MTEKKNFEAKFEEGKLNIHIDSNRDGENLMEAKVNLNEALQEIIARGEKVEGAKLVAFEMGIDGLKIKLDTDQDGEELLELKISFVEALDESGLAAKLNG